MALITCKDCNREISDYAVACPHCGRPMREVSAPARVVEKVVVEKSKEGLFLQSLNGGCGCLLVIFALLVFIAVLSPSK